MDKWIIQKAQIGYDYIWDRWGIFVGDIHAATILLWGLWFLVGDTSIIIKSIVFIVVVHSLFVGAIKTGYQKNGNFATLNLWAEVNEKSRIFLFIRNVLVITLPLAIWQLEFGHIAILSWLYVNCIRVRKRNNIKKLVLAHSH